MSLRLLGPVVLGLIGLVSFASCAVTEAPEVHGVADGQVATPATRPDPREQDPWFAAGRTSVRESSRFIAGEAPARNVILFVGDGMGISTVTAARILEGQRQGESGEGHRLAFEILPYVALSKTYSTDAQVADSAATITAMLSGVKTKSAVLGVDDRIRRGDYESVDASRVLTILEEAEDRGLATGIVTTTSVTHATPAGCYAHVPLRSWEDDSRMPEAAREARFPDIALQLVEFDHGDGIDVVLGGGRAHFRPAGAPDPEEASNPGRRLDGRDLIDEWTGAREGSLYVWNREQLTTVDRRSARHLLGLFEPDAMKFEADRAHDAAGEPSLAEMTHLAIDLLSRNRKGYFLLVEGGRIDHGHHDGNAYHALTDTLAFSDAVRVALETTHRDDTLIVVTADHSHTLTISGYPVRGNPILGKVVEMSRTAEGETQPARDANGQPYTTLSYANGPGHVPGEGSGRSSNRPDLTGVDTSDPRYLQEATVPMESETHGGEDVAIFAGGPRAALFHGVQEQNYVYHALVEALGWTRDGMTPN
jgi:alkaline phosphatase